MKVLGALNPALGFVSATTSALQSTGSAAVRPLRSVSSTQRKDLAAKVQDALSEWSCQWDLETTATRTESTCNVPALTVRDACAAGGANEARDWQPVASHPGMWWSTDIPALSARSILLEALFNEAPELAMAPSGGVPAMGTRLADALADAAWHDWQVVLGAAITGEDPDQSTAHETPSAACAPWSGALRVDFAWCGHPMSLLVSAAVVARTLEVNRVASHARRQAGSDVLSSAPPLAPRASRATAEIVPLLAAARQYRIAMAVELAPLELGLGVITGLKVGDILRTRHDLSTPLRMRATGTGLGDDVLCTAFLGHDGGRRAIELIGGADSLGSA